MSGWVNMEAAGEVHTLPVDDLHIHTFNRWCICKPKQDSLVVGVWVHNAFDQRELKEPDHLQ